MRRHPENPLITAADVRPSNPAYRVRGAFNPGACTFGGETLLLLRVAEDVPADPAGWRSRWCGSRTAAGSPWAWRTCWTWR